MKEYQKNKKNKTDTNADNKTPVESLTNSTHSSLNEIQHLDENETLNQSVHSVSPLQQYFTGGNLSVFDEISHKHNANDEFYKFDVITYNTSDCNNGIVKMGVQDEHKAAIPIGNPTDTNTEETHDAVAVEDPEIVPNEIYNRLNAINNTSDTTHENEPPKAVELFLGTTGTENTSLNNTGSTPLCSNDNVNNVQENMQSLKQLSTQIIQLIDDNNIGTLSTRSSFESPQKNDKVYEYLELEQQKYKKLWDEMCICNSRIEELERESQILKETDGKSVIFMN